MTDRGQVERESMSSAERTGNLILEASNLDIVFKTDSGGLSALNDVNFQIYAHEFISLVGPSGCGKSTLLRTLAGLIPPSAGQIRFAPQANGHRPRIGYVFQDANLMPWRTALENIALPLELKGIERSHVDQQALALIELMGLQGFENVYPADLSGGMAQRVSIARALIHDPDVLLLDEPFGALDTFTRERMGAEVIRIWGIRPVTIILVTHSISEAIRLADRVLVMSTRPAHIELDLDIPLQRPRPLELIYTSEFGELAGRIRSSIAG